MSIEDEVKASEQERAQMLFEQVKIQIEANRMKQAERLKQGQRKTFKPRHRRA